MDTYQIHKTPVEGLWEIAILGKRPMNHHMIHRYPKRSWCIPDKRIENLLKFLQVKYRNRSYINPNANFFHMDSIKTTRWMLVCLACINGESGTIFARGSLKPFITKPWRVYLVRATTRHMSPDPHVGDKRYLFRFDISESDSYQFEALVKDL